jgi:PAS domain S-box-containing protein
LSGAILSDPQTGQPQYFASMIQDIDARKKAEFALAEAESRWHFALESAGQGVWDYRVAEGKTFYSKTWKAIIGYEENEIADAGELWQSFVHPDDLPRVMASDKDHLAGLTPYFECEFRMRHKQGHWVWISDRGKVIARAADGRPLRMIGTHTDISARKAADDAIRETGERYRLLADNSTDMIMRVRKSGRRVYVSPGLPPSARLGAGGNAGYSDQRRVASRRRRFVDRSVARRLRERRGDGADLPDAAQGRRLRLGRIDLARAAGRPKRKARAHPRRARHRPARRRRAEIERQRSAPPFARGICDRHGVPARLRPRSQLCLSGLS